MKRLKSILCLMIMIFAGFFSLTACGNNDNGDKTKPATTTETTITLAEAKTTIINALAINESQIIQTIETANSSNNEIENRNLLEKLGSFEWFGATTTSPKSGSEIEERGYVSYKNGNIVKYLISTTATTGGQPALAVYCVPNEETYVKIDNDVNPNSQYANNINTILSFELNMITSFFTETAFNICYKEDVIKTIGNSGYSLKLELNLKGYMYLSLGGMSEEQFNEWWGTYETAHNDYPQEMKDFEKFEVIINFTHNNEITEANINFNYVSPQGSPSGNMTYYKTTSAMNLKKYNSEITEPQWVTEYKAK